MCKKRFKYRQLTFALLLSLLAVLVISPAMAQAADIFTPLNRPIETDGAIGALVTHPNGLIYGATHDFQDGRDDLQLFSINPENNETVPLGPIPYGGLAVWALTVEKVNPLDPLGYKKARIFGATYGGHIFAYDPFYKTFSYYGRAVDLSASDYDVLDLMTASDGRIYGASGSNAENPNAGRMFWFDPPPSGSPAVFHDLGKPIDADDCIYYLFERYVDENNRKIYGSTGLFPRELNPVPGTHGHLVCYDPIIPGAMAVDKGYALTGAVASGAMLKPDDKIIVGGSTRPRSGGLPGLDISSWVYSPDVESGKFSTPVLQNMPAYAGVQLSGYVFDSTNRQFVGFDLYDEQGISGTVVQWPCDDSANPVIWGVPVPGQTGISAMVLGADNKMYGGTFPNGHLFVFNPLENTETLAGTGAPVEVSPPSNLEVKIKFDNVSQSGVTTVNETQTPPVQAPTGFKFLGNTFDISTTAIRTGNITITLPYTHAALSAAGMAEDDLQIIHYVAGEETYPLSTVDKAGDTVTCTVDSLSPFVIVGPSGSGGGSAPSPGISTGMNIYWLLAQAMIMLLAGLYLTRKSRVLRAEIRGFR